MQLCYCQQHTCSTRYEAAIRRGALQDGSHSTDFAAAKARTGHAEACAGALGLLFVSARLSESALVPITHLRVVNVHVASILASRNARVAALLPKQAGPRACSPHGHAGVSAFAFQVSYLSSSSTFIS